MQTLILIAVLVLGIYMLIWSAGTNLLGAGLVIVSVVFLLHPAFGHDHNRPHLNDWLKLLHSKGGAWCCNGDDTDEIDDWDTKDNGYRVKFRGQWYDVPPEAIVEGPNNSGTPLLWMYKGWGEQKPRCFMPGSMT